MAYAVAEAGIDPVAMVVLKLPFVPSVAVPDWPSTVTITVSPAGGVVVGAVNVPETLMDVVPYAIDCEAVKALNIGAAWFTVSVVALLAADLKLLSPPKE